MAAAVPAAAAAAAPVVAPAAAGAGKGAATAAAGTAGAAGAAGAAGGGGGLAGLMASPWFKLLAPTVLGMVSAGSPQSAAGVRTGLGAFDLLTSLEDKGSVAKAMEGYSSAVSGDVRREVMDRQMNEAILSLGADDPSGGPVTTLFQGQPMQTLKAHEAAVATLPATGRANPAQAGFMLSSLARGAPSPTPRPPPEPSLYDTKEQFQRLFPGHDLSAEMRDGKLYLSADTPTEKEPEKEPAQLTPVQQAALIKEIADTPGGVDQKATVLGPLGAERTITSRARGGGAAVAGATGYGTVNPEAGQLLFNRSTGTYAPIPPEILEFLKEKEAMEEAGGIGGVVIRNPDGTLSISRRGQ